MPHSARKRYVFAISAFIFLLSGLGQQLVINAPKALANPANKSACWYITGVPDTIVAGQGFYALVAIQNTGTHTWWPTTHHLGPANPMDNSFWNVPRQNIGIASVPPGSGVTFGFNVIAPNVPGTHRFDFQMLNDWVEWFGPVCGKTVTILPQTNNSACVEIVAPDTLAPGQGFAARVTFKNTGTKTWGKVWPNEYHLGTADARDNGFWGIPRQPMNVASVPPGHNVSFQLWGVAPNVPGTHRFSFQMLNDWIEWFGPTCAKAITIVAPAPAPAPAPAAPPIVAPTANVVSNNPSAPHPIGVYNNGAQCVTVSAPDVVTAGNQFFAYITMKNTGKKTWVAGGVNPFHLGTATPRDNGFWAVPRQAMTPGYSVAPGGTYTFSFNATAPNAHGFYPFHFQMLEELVEWFGEECGKQIQIVPPTFNAARCVSVEAPDTVTPGQSFYVKVNMRNIGTRTWSPGGVNPHRLGTADPRDNGTFGVPRQEMTSQAGPEQNYTFAFNATAPAAPGRYNMNFQMLQELKEWYGDVCGKVVTVAAPAAPVAAVIAPPPPEPAQQNAPAANTNEPPEDPFFQSWRKYVEPQEPEPQNQFQPQEPQVQTNQNQQQSGVGLFSEWR